MTKEDSIKMIKYTLEHLRLDKDMDKEEYQRILDNLIQTVIDPGTFAIEVLNLLYRCKSEGMYQVYDDMLLLHHHILTLYHAEMLN